MMHKQLGIGFVKFDILLRVMCIRVIHYILLLPFVPLLYAVITYFELYNWFYYLAIVAFFLSSIFKLH